MSGQDSTLQGLNFFNSEFSPLKSSSDQWVASVLLTSQTIDYTYRVQLLVKTEKVSTPETKGLDVDLEDTKEYQ